MFRAIGRMFGGVLDVAKETLDRSNLGICRLLVKTDILRQINQEVKT